MTFSLDFAKRKRELGSRKENFRSQADVFNIEMDRSQVGCMRKRNCTDEAL